MASLLSLLTALVLGALMGFGLTRLSLPALSRYARQQHVREDVPETHRHKAGTPSMGGIPMLIAAIAAAAISALLIGNFSRQLLPAFGLVGAFAAIGLIDDLKKLGSRRSKGLLARYRIAAQLVAATLFMLTRRTWAPPAMAESSWLGTAFWGPAPAIVLGVLAIVGTANAVNLTDGLDGLAAGLAAIAAVALGLASKMLGAPDIATWAVAIGGACAGFLILNAKPAKVWMGDVGSLGLGAALATVALLARLEFLFLIIAAVFVIEALSVILQVISFQSSGRRIFRMSPLHHHFELCGMSEQDIVTWFWVAGIVAMAIGLTALTATIAS